MPDESFVLVDDYWYSFIMSHKFGRKLRKLSTKDQHILDRTDDSGIKFYYFSLFRLESYLPLP